MRKQLLVILFTLGISSAFAQGAGDSGVGPGQPPCAGTVCNVSGIVAGNGSAALPVGTSTPSSEIIGTTTPTAMLPIGRWSANTSPPETDFYKSRGSSIGAEAALNNNDQIGVTRYYGDDGATAGGLDVAEFRVTAGCAFSSGSGCGTMFWYLRNTTGSLTPYLAIGPTGVVTNAGTPLYSSTAPTLTGTGTPAFNGAATNWAGEVATGTLATSVVVTFAGAPLSNSPICTVTWQNGIPGSYTVTSSAITITQAAATGNLIDYICFQH